MRRGWEVELQDGTILSEETNTWKEVPKKKIKRLTLHYEGRRWDLQDKEAYFVRNTASMIPCINESFRVEKRRIGYYEGDTKVVYELDEFSGEMKIKLS